MKKKLVIFGTDIMGKLMNYYFSRDSEYEVVAFTVDEIYKNQDTYLELPLISFEKIEEFYPQNEFNLFIAIGPSKMNTNREAKFIEAKNKGYRCASYISPRAICNSEIGENNFIGDMAVINPYVKIGNNNLIWEHCIISADSIIENNCYLSPNSSIGTFSTIKNNSIVGAGSVVKTSIVVAEKTLIGAASFISSNTKPFGVYGEKNSILYGCISEKINIAL
jgi:sugar O-acyltransferase (sialic acid O-acetyltransferase NeuD family)